jgi:hypothetical protein
MNLSTLTGRLGLVRVAALALLLTAPLVSGAERVIEVTFRDGYNGALLLNSKARKIYVGWTEGDVSPQEGLLVCDLGKDGSLLPGERVYPNSPDPRTPPGIKGVNSLVAMALSPNGRMLYLGLRNPPASVAKPLVVYDLDEKGEPKGKPRSYAIGNFHSGVRAMIADPKRACLYVIGHGGTGLFTMPLKPDGEPTGEPTNSQFGYNNKTSFALSEDSRYLYFVDEPSTLEVGTLDDQGQVDKPEKLTISNVRGHPLVACAGRGLFILQGDQFYIWPLDEGHFPIGEMMTSPPSKIPVQAICEGTHPYLYAALNVFEDGEVGKGEKPGVAGVKLARYLPDAKGNLGKPEYLSEILDFRLVNAIAVDESTKVIYVTTREAPKSRW